MRAFLNGTLLAVLGPLVLIFRRGPRRPLAIHKPQIADANVPLGMEALDLDAVDAVNRRNNALDRAASSPFQRNRRLFGTFSSKAETGVTAMPDDETYAARYHRAFQAKDVKND